MTIKIAVIGGSGVYDVEGLENIKEVDVDTPFGLPSDSIITGTFNGIKVVFLPRHGRGHYIMPSSINCRANIFALKKLGVQKIISLSAVGSMKEEIVPGDMVIVDQFFDRTKTRPSSFFGNGLVAHVSFSDPVCSVLSDELSKSCKTVGVKSHKGGTYVCIEGPQFSTRGESLIYRQWGVDVVGMTALPEAKLAREAEICYCLVALVTDYDCWHTTHGDVSVEMVVQTMNKNSLLAKKVLKEVIPKIAMENIAECSCRTALKNAIMTSPEKINKKMRKELDILMDRDRGCK